MQCDEKWAVVGKKEKPGDPEEPADTKRGDNGDHVALDPEHRLVVSVGVGKRTAENIEKVVQDFKARTGGRPMNLSTSDEYPAYPPAILAAYGQVVVPPRTRAIALKSVSKHERSQISFIPARLEAFVVDTHFCRGFLA